MRKKKVIFFPWATVTVSRPYLSTHVNSLTYRSRLTYTHSLLALFFGRYYFFNMPFLKWLKATEKKTLETKNAIEDVDDEEERRRDEGGRDTNRNNEEEEARRNDGTKIVYFAFGIPQQNIIDILKSLNKDPQVH